MSYFSTYYDRMVTRLDAVFPAASGWMRIPNPYDLERNNDQVLQKGWGLAIQDGANMGALSCNFRTARNWKVVICRQAMALEHDVASLATVEKLLMEDWRLIIKDFETNVTLDSGNGSTQYVSDTGVQLLRGENARLYTEILFVTQMIENLLA